VDAHLFRWAGDRGEVAEDGWSPGALPREAAGAIGYAIYPPTRHLAVKVRLFIDFLVERFSAGPEAGIGRSSAMDA
jgi:DNA-binding transcriptional LysR family regulator